MPVETSAATLGLLAAAGAVGAAAGYAYAKTAGKPKPVYAKVGKVKELFIYPIKSCRPIAVQEADIGPLGLYHGDLLRDRVFMITDAKYHFITARQEGRFVLIQPSFHGNQLWLDAPEMETLKMDIPSAESKSIKGDVWGSVIRGIDCGREVAKWIETFVGKAPNSIRLMYYPWESTDRLNSDITNFGRSIEKKDVIVYHDTGPVLLLPEASLNDFNSRIDKPISQRNFRSNIFVEGSYPYDEDAWTYVKIGDSTTFRCVRPCTRCVLTTIDPDTGIRGEEPLKTLKKYRQITDPKYRSKEGESPRFGIYLGSDRFGKIKIGDDVYAAH